MSRPVRRVPDLPEAVAHQGRVRCCVAVLCGLELCFALLAGLAAFFWLAPWSLLAGLVAASVCAATVFSLALFALIWPHPLLRSLQALADQYGTHPADLLLWIYAPELLLVVAQSGSLVALSGRIAPGDGRVALWIALQGLVLLPSLLKRRKNRGAIASRLVHLRKVGKR